MSNINLIDSFQEFKDFKNIDRPTVISVLEEVFRSMLRKRYGTDENCDVIVNPDNGDLEIWRTRTVMEDGFSEDDDLEIELAEAKAIDPDLEVGDDFIEQITLESFGRRAILAARQTLVSKILELEKDEIFKKYKDRVGEIVTGEVYQVWKKETLVLDDEGNELLLPKTEQIPADYFKKGDSVRAIIEKVEMLNGNPKIIISRTAPEFLQRLFEMEVPEIFDGLITIKKIVREPGERAKVAVESYDDRIDPVGACVGMKGSRIHGIVRELKNENIDVINFTNNISLYIQRALSPAKITSIKLDDEEKRAAVYLKPDQVSLAIGRGGHNIKLAGKLTGYEIDVYREAHEDDEDVDIEEFSDEIEGWIIDEFKRVGLDTAKSILSLSVDELVKRTDLEDTTVKDVIEILKSEFE
ncbi:MAG: transcription termination/antitermination protein NusA [Sphingobacteriales bacterium 17-39-43]|jgi:N utilization substance protein A|uniref:transcription termination factor NusA n=1 Tax=Daejeonella sp. TaxID=2805397 RepID=UPI000BCF2DC0|nr:transcription termination factor NusA [Daejeonella sp.]MCF8451566.1 transcription termination factor NusA [Pedobacter sp.]OYZ30815.1 MAG: transcription termination/antitermination protein NusA [Sphingobacteriales bacterium 16-39-50]OZA23565.1 MAG: transcription termination/antitermination protein NusA [Sphingobacteriales bacterium 17-39-43]HQT23761.1 transcription termination factor NusA [Daejeonella sp.]HQT58486.1 transcription termination factor NusA [Daejeonella sp.]